MTRHGIIKTTRLATAGMRADGCLDRPEWRRAFATLFRELRRHRHEPRPHEASGGTREWAAALGCWLQVYLEQRTAARNRSAYRLDLGATCELIRIACQWANWKDAQRNGPEWTGYYVGWPWSDAANVVELEAVEGPQKAKVA